MATTTIYHNPRCSKSRQAIALLENQEIEHEVIDYSRQPLSMEQLQQILAWLDGDLLAMTRTKDQAFKDAKLDLQKPDAQSWLGAMQVNPKIMQRPIVVYQNKAVVARPTEKLLELY